MKSTSTQTYSCKILWLLSFAVISHDIQFETGSKFLLSLSLDMSCRREKSTCIWRPRTLSNCDRLGDNIWSRYWTRPWPLFQTPTWGYYSTEKHTNLQKSNGLQLSFKINAVCWLHWWIRIAMFWGSWCPLDDSGPLLKSLGVNWTIQLEWGLWEKGKVQLLYTCFKISKMDYKFDKAFSLNDTVW